ncbi:MAG: hypothetical protein K5886_08535 [Lachnospiraceae bacterium]|nr:hypothetical protein [Lachnospiraceae bacterium]
MIAFVTEGGNDIGMGHYIRCFGIAESLAAQGEDICFIIPPDADGSFPESTGFDTHMLQKSPASGWDVDEVCALLRKLNISTVIADSYRLDNDDLGHIRNVCRIIFLDDLDTYDCNVDAVINFTPGADEDKYLVADVPGREVYAGAEFYPLRREFEGKRKPDLRKNVRTVLLTSGSTDPYECVLFILKEIGPDLYRDISFVVLVGRYYLEEYKDKLSVFCGSHKNVSLHAWGNCISDELAKADIIITPGSSTVMEGLSLNVPCIIYEFADNQHETVKWLEGSKMAASFGRLPVGENDACVRKVFDAELDQRVRLYRSSVYSGAFDGKGLNRVTDIIRRRIY